MNKFFKGDIVKFNNDFFQTSSNIIGDEECIPVSVIAFIKNHYCGRPVGVVENNVDGSAVMIDIPDNEASSMWAWKSKWFDLFEKEIYVRQEEIIKLI